MNGVVCHASWFRTTGALAVTDMSERKDWPSWYIWSQTRFTTEDGLRIQKWHDGIPTRRTWADSVRGKFSRVIYSRIAAGSWTPSTITFSRILVSPQVFHHQPYLCDYLVGSWDVSIRLTEPSLHRLLWYRWAMLYLPHGKEQTLILSRICIKTEMPRRW